MAIKSLAEAVKFSGNFTPVRILEKAQLIKSICKWREIACDDFDDEIFADEK